MSRRSSLLAGEEPLEGLAGNHRLPAELKDLTAELAPAQEVICSQSLIPRRDGGLPDAVGACRDPVGERVGKLGRLGQEPARLLNQTDQARDRRRAGPLADLFEYGGQLLERLGGSGQSWLLPAPAGQGAGQVGDPLRPRQIAAYSTRLSVGVTWGDAV